MLKYVLVAFLKLQKLRWVCIIIWWDPCQRELTHAEKYGT